MPKILLVEDDEATQKLVVKALARIGVEVSIADNACEAVARASSESFDLILMDIRMPEMDGCQATRAIRAKGVSVPIIAYTAQWLRKNSDNNVFRQVAMITSQRPLAPMHCMT